MPPGQGSVRSGLALTAQASQRELEGEEQHAQGKAKFEVRYLVNALDGSRPGFAQCQGVNKAEWLPPGYIIQSG